MLNTKRFCKSTQTIVGFNEHKQAFAGDITYTNIPSLNNGNPFVEGIIHENKDQPENKQHPFCVIKNDVEKLFASIFNNKLDQNSSIVDEASYILNFVNKCCDYISGKLPNRGDDPIWNVEVAALLGKQIAPIEPGGPITPQDFATNRWWHEEGFDESTSSSTHVDDLVIHVGDLILMLARKIKVLSM